MAIVKMVLAAYLQVLKLCVNTMLYLEVGRCYQAILQHPEMVVLQNPTWKIKMSNLLKKICANIYHTVYTYTHT